MPRYTYKCSDCYEVFDVFHGMDETHEVCGFCKSINLVRVPQMPHVARKQTTQSSNVGDEVKRAIEENREILKEQRKKRVELPND